MQDLYERFGLVIHGRAFAPNTSRQVAARLMTRAPVQGEGASDGDVVVDVLDESGKVLMAAPLSEITVDPPLGSVARRLHFPDRGLFETDDRAGVARLTGNTAGEKLHLYEQLHPRLLAVIACLCVAIWVIWRWGLDILVSAAIALTPAVLTEQIDKGTLQTIDFAMAVPTKLPQEQQARVTDIFTKLLTELDPDDVDDTTFELLFRSMPAVGPNAFALPGGTVIMTDQFIEEFPQDDVLAGVLGHEIGHVVEKHGLRQTYRSLGIYVLVAFLAGETGPFLEEVLLEGNLLLSLKFSRDHEASADEFGVNLTSAAGFDPAGLKIFFDKVSEMAVAPPEWMSTHPSSEGRIESIDGYIDALR